MGPRNRSLDLKHVDRDTLITTEGFLRGLQEFRATVTRTPPMRAREAGRLHATGRIDKYQHAVCR